MEALLSGQSNGRLHQQRAANRTYSTRKNDQPDYLGLLCQREDLRGSIPRLFQGRPTYAQQHSPAKEDHQRARTDRRRRNEHSQYHK